VRKSWDVAIFLFWVWDVCLGVLLGFDDDGDDGEREERKRKKKRGVCVSGLGRVWDDVLCWFGMDRGFSSVDAAAAVF
jgi:hypothetical protein